jgi:hypothetical protein
MSDAIEVITLARGTADEDGNWVSGGGHRVHADWSSAEREVKARVLRSLAARSNPPDGVAFVRAWETPAIPHLDALADPRATAREAADMLVTEAAASCALDGDTHSLSNTGPAAEMAAAARETARLASITCKTCHGKLDVDGTCGDCAVKSTKGRRRGR